MDTRRAACMAEVIVVLQLCLRNNFRKGKRLKMVIVGYTKISFYAGYFHVLLIYTPFLGPAEKEGGYSNQAFIAQSRLQDSSRGSQRRF